MGSEIPEEAKEKVLRFHEELNRVEASLSGHLSSPELPASSTSSLELARADLTTAYAASSLLWIYLCTKGSTPLTNQPLKAELERIQGYMKRLKEVEERANAPRLNRHVAKAMVRNAVFDPQNRSDLPDSSAV